MTINGTAGDDTLTGTTGNDVISGGDGRDTLYGLDGNDTLDGGRFGDTMYGGAGDDLYIVDDTGTVNYVYVGDLVVENPGEGNDTIQVVYSFTLPDNVENLVLVAAAANGSAFTLTGNTGDNTLTGTAGIELLYGGAGNDALYGQGGNDSLNGEAGADTMVGGTGDDRYWVDDAGDVVSENASEGNDGVYSSISYVLPSNVENLYVVGNGAITATGNALDNVIGSVGGITGDNVIDGGAGADQMSGGLGDDIYYVDSDLDVVNESAGQGFDTVCSSTFHVLEANVEAVVLTGTGDTWAMGNDIANFMYGNVGNNSFTAGSGVATMYGGAGDDIYYVNNVADQVIENASEGFDTIFSSVSYTLGANVDVLCLTGTADISATGNDIFNFLYGNTGNNTLTSGSGMAYLLGCDGNDTYYLSNAAIGVVEAASGGFDSLYIGASYTLSDYCEALHLTGTGDFSAAGNGFTHSLYGNSGNNSLTAGAGAATMYGGAGDDLYYVNKAGDQVVENAGQGFDTVFSTAASYTLASNIEALCLTGGGNIAGTGNSGANFLYGNSGNNTLDGGTGNDALYGGLGADRFVFGSGFGADTVSDFSHAQGDMLDLTAFHTTFAALTIAQSGSDAVITGLGSGLSITLTGVLASSLVDTDFLL